MPYRVSEEAGWVTNNKDVFLTILRLHVLDCPIQYVHNLQVDLQDVDGDEEDDTDLRTLIADKDDSDDYN